MKVRFKQNVDLPFYDGEILRFAKDKVYNMELKYDRVNIFVSIDGHDLSYEIIKYLKPDYTEFINVWLSKEEKRKLRKSL